MSGPPDIDKLLAVLSSGTPPAPVQNQVGYGYRGYEAPSQRQHEEQEQILELNLAASKYQQASQYPHVQPGGRQRKALPTTTTSIQSNDVSSKSVNPSTIIAWSAGHRYMARHLLIREEFRERTQVMIRKEAFLAKTLFEERQALEKKLTDRLDGHKNVEDILRSMHAPASERGSRQIIQDNAKEIKAFDRKIWIDMGNHEKRFANLLIELRVPFFVLRSEFVVDDKAFDQEKDRKAGRISQGELHILKVRMLKYIHDIFDEDEVEE